MHEKLQAHHLIEHLAHSWISGCCSSAEVMTDPLARSLATAPVDDEPVPWKKLARLLPPALSLYGSEGTKQAERASRVRTHLRFPDQRDIIRITAIKHPREGYG